MLHLRRSLSSCSLAESLVGWVLLAPFLLVLLLYAVVLSCFAVVRWGLDSAVLRKAPQKLGKRRCF